MYVCMPNVYVCAPSPHAPDPPGLTPVRPVRSPSTAARSRRGPGRRSPPPLPPPGGRPARHRDGRKRGLWCGMGACFDCVVTIDGRAGQRACLAKVEAGMVVSSPAAAIEHGTARGRAAAAAEEMAVDVAVVGAGPAGLTSRRISPAPGSRSGDRRARRPGRAVSQARGRLPPRAPARSTASSRKGVGSLPPRAKPACRFSRRRPSGRLSARTRSRCFTRAASASFGQAPRPRAGSL